MGPDAALAAELAEESGRLLGLLPDDQLRALAVRERSVGRRGLWYTARDVPPGRIRRVIDFGELAASPADVPAA